MGAENGSMAGNKNDLVVITVKDLKSTSGTDRQLTGG
jgi:hypothetical protein